jgi:DNA-binding LacI/PurR family transcriptional regulator
MGKRGARILLDRIANPSDQKLIAEVLIEPDLVIRESTGPVKK